MRTRKGALLAVASITALIFAVGSLARSRSGGGAGEDQIRPALTSGEKIATAADLATLRESVARLEAQLEIERAARRQLARRVEGLRGEAAALPDPGTPAAAHAAAASPAAEPDSSPPSHRVRSGSRFDERALLDAGFTRSEVAAFRGRVDDIQLQRLYLRDRATREDWLDTPRYRQESQALDDELFGTRDEFGEEMYDWTLYTTGHPNRVSVSEVMEGSAAADAGFASGDVILSYADRRIFSAGELRDETSRGTAGETIPVEVSRGDEILRVYVPRGPLGIMLEPSLREPPRVR